MRKPSLSGEQIRSSASGIGPRMADPIFAAPVRARQIMLEPEPLRKPPTAPAFSPARITRESCGISFSR